MSTHPRCTAHLSCRIPASIPLADVHTETRFGPTARVYQAVVWTVTGDELGTFTQDGPNRRTVFSGGNIVSSQVEPATDTDAIRLLLAHVADSAFHFRMALHG